MILVAVGIGLVGAILIAFGPRGGQGGSLIGLALFVVQTVHFVFAQMVWQMVYGTSVRHVFGLSSLAVLINFCVGVLTTWILGVTFRGEPMAVTRETTVFLGIVIFGIPTIVLLVANVVTSLLSRLIPKQAGRV
jgi:hypothetical protein